jgi:hypothetical protein
MKMLALLAVIGFSVGCGRAIVESPAVSITTPGEASPTRLAPASPSPTQEAPPSAESPPPPPPKPANSPSQCNPQQQVAVEGFTGRPGRVPGTVDLAWTTSGGCPYFVGTIVGFRCQRITVCPPWKLPIAPILGQPGSYTDTPPASSPSPGGPSPSPGCLTSIYYQINFDGGPERFYGPVIRVDGVVCS